MWLEITVWALPLWNFSSIGGTIFLTLRRMSFVAVDISGDWAGIRRLVRGKIVEDIPTAHVESEYVDTLKPIVALLRDYYRLC